MDIGKEEKEIVVIPLKSPVRAPEPPSKPIPKREPTRRKPIKEPA